MGFASIYVTHDTHTLDLLYCEMNGMPTPVCCLYFTYSCPKNRTRYSSSSAVVKWRVSMRFPECETMLTRLQLTVNSLLEEPPQYYSITHQTNHISQYHLRAQTPPEEPKISRVPRESIHAISHQHMILLPKRLHDMVEVRPRLRHGRSPDRLPHDHETQPQGHPGSRIRPGKEILKYRKDRLKMHKTFEESAEVCDVVGTSVIQQES